MLEAVEDKFDDVVVLEVVNGKLELVGDEFIEVVLAVVEVVVKLKLSEDELERLVDEV